MKRICNKCHIEKDINEFYNNFLICKKCKMQYQKEYERKNKEKIRIRKKIYMKQYNEKNKERKKIYNQKYHQLNKKKYNEYSLNYKKTHKEQYEASLKKFYDKVKSDKRYIFKYRIKARIRNAFRGNKYRKKSKTFEMIGCEFENFLSYLLQTFKNNYGYEWDGIEKVHIDHIIPLATARTEEEMIKLCHYTNLQLLKAKDNMQKGAKLDWSLK